ncbi:hypothetical protein [Peribacillus simplex]|uniref:hypothetical protein n=1 Tax=Peribacillus simplex TaxID=1478 RepID=UPI0036720513
MKIKLDQTKFRASSKEEYLLKLFELELKQLDEREPIYLCVKLHCQKHLARSIMDEIRHGKGLTNGA